MISIAFVPTSSLYFYCMRYIKYKAHVHKLHYNESAVLFHVRMLYTFEKDLSALRASLRSDNNVDEVTRLHSFSI